MSSINNFGLLCVLSLLICCYTQSAPVKFLPGFAGPLPFYFETGYVAVGEREEVQLFYYFAESESNPRDDPLMIWLTGGPGCSSATGLMYEIGPLMFEPLELYNGSFPSLHLNPNSWTKMASIIFVDLPAGTGFTYGKTDSASKSTQLQLCEQAYEFLKKWLINHPEFIANPFYVGGDSYSGLTVPIITQMISDGNEAGIEQFINLKGYVLGNPLSFPEQDNYQITFAHGMGLIPDELYLKLKKYCGEEYRVQYIDPDNRLCLRYVEAYHEVYNYVSSSSLFSLSTDICEKTSLVCMSQCLDGLYVGQILEPNCDPFLPRPTDERRVLEERYNELNYPKHWLMGSFCRYNGYKVLYYWADDVNVREALHIKKGSVGKWKRCNYGVPYTTMTWDVRSYHVNLSKKGYRSLIYSGDHDSIVVYQSTESWIRSLNYSIVDPWRAWKVHGQIAGYTRSFSNKMTFATVKGGGHTAPEYKPEECFAMFRRWISHQPL